MGNIYGDQGQCTWYIGSIDPWIDALGNLGNANEWYGNAPANIRSTTPKVGDVAVWGSGLGGASSLGHVAQVVGIDNQGHPIVQEMNWPEGDDKVTTRDTALNNSYQGIIGYLQPPGGGETSSPTTSGGGGIDFNPLDKVGEAFNSFTTSLGHMFLVLGLVLVGIMLVAMGIMGAAHESA